MRKQYLIHSKWLNNNNNNHSFYVSILEQILTKFLDP